VGGVTRPHAGGGDVAALVRRHRPGFEVREVVPLGTGTDNAAVLVNGELVVRQSLSGRGHPPDDEPGSDADADDGEGDGDGDSDGETTGDSDDGDGLDVGREAALLELLGRRLSVPVPEVVFVDADARALGYRLLPGRPLLGHPHAPAAPDLAEALGRTLHELHGTPPSAVDGLVDADPYPLAAYLAEAADAYRAVVGHVPPADRPALERFLAAAPPPEPTSVVLCHNDLGAEHLLVEWTGRALTLTGVIDWTDAALADPARDLARLQRDLGADMVEAIAAADGRDRSDADRERTTFLARCALLEDLAHGVATPDAELYATAALARLGEVFA
jgi:aminoglycoside phosphotransferase